MNRYLFIFAFCLCPVVIVTDEDSRSGAIVPDYGFIAYLYSTLNESIRCTGAIVSDSWILNYCEYGLYVYDAVRVGIAKPVARNRVKDFIYGLVERVTLPGHDIQPFPQINEDYDLEYLYASQNSIFLDRTNKPMVLNVDDAVWPIVLSRTSELPQKAYAHFFSKADAIKGSTKARHKELDIVNNSYCNDYFQTYNLGLQNTQFCVNSSMVSYDDCCANHAIMESDMKLIGILAWSTACWNPPEPWVFTNLGWHYDWITNITSWDPLFPPSFMKTHKKQVTNFVPHDLVTTFTYKP